MEVIGNSAVRRVMRLSIIMCPIAITYSMVQITNRFASVSVSVSPSVGTLTVAFLDRLSPKLAQT